MSQGVLLDLAGVLYDGDRAVPGAVEAVARLRSAGMPLRFLTNSTRRSKRAILGQLNKMGLDVAPTEMLTPAEAASQWLRREGYTPHLLVHPALEEDFADTPGSGKTAVVVGDAGPYFNFERLNAAYRELAKGAPFLALAANRVFRDADGELSLDAGAFVHALEFSSGEKAHLFGKPAPAFFGAAVDALGGSAASVTMIGDDAESDVAGALCTGLGQAILVRTGKYRAGDETRFDPRPSACVADVGEAASHVLGQASGQ